MSIPCDTDRWNDKLATLDNLEYSCLSGVTSHKFELRIVDEVLELLVGSLCAHGVEAYGEVTEVAKANLLTL